MSDPSVKRLASERGMAFVVTLIALVVVAVLGLAVVQNSVSGLRTSGNDATSKTAAAIAESGAEFTREVIRTRLIGGQTINQLLSTAANGGSLVNATTLAAFGNTTATSNGTGNQPLVASRDFGGGKFQVFLTNDLLEGGAASESVTKITDSNNRVMITSFAGRSGAASCVQEELGLVDAFLPGWNLPGVINLPGPDVNFASFASNARFVYGYAPGDVGKSGNTHCHPTIAVSTDAAKRKVDAIMCTPGNCSSGQYTSCGAFANTAFSCPTNNNGNGNGMVQSAGGSGGSVGAAFNPSTLNFMRARSNPYDPTDTEDSECETLGFCGNPKLIRVDHLEHLKNKVIGVAHCRSASDCSSPYGTTTAPMIVAISGDFTIRGNESGVGILLVTGKLTFSGTPDYKGLILVIGAGEFEQIGAGNGNFNGAMLIANTDTPWVEDERYVGIPSYSINGGGNSEAYYDSGALTRYAAATMPLQTLTFRFVH